MLAYTEIEQDHFGETTDILLYNGNFEEFKEKLNNIFFDEIEVLFHNHKQFVIYCGGGIVINGFETNNEEYIQIKKNNLIKKMNLLLKEFENIEFEFEDFKISYDFKKVKNSYKLNEVEFETRKELYESFEAQMRIKYA